jgi:hypothetical protein
MERKIWVMTLIWFLFALTATAQDMRLTAYNDYVDSKFDGCSEKSVALLSAVDKTRVEMNSRSRSNTDASVKLECTTDGRLAKLTGSDGQTFKVFQSGFFNGGVVITFVDENGAAINSIPVTKRELEASGVSLSSLSRAMEFAPRSLSSSLLMSHTELYKHSVHAKIFVDLTPGEDCLKACDMMLDAMNDYCVTIDDPQSRLSCKFNGINQWKGCRSNCSGR